MSGWRKRQITDDDDIAWYDPTNHHVSTDKNDPLFTPLGQVWPLDVRRTWVGLTADEYAELAEEYGPFPINQIEAKLKEKNFD